MSGFGTVVTGTLSDGHLALGDEVEILPSGQRGRIRGLQTHRKKEELAVPGSRTAVNISGIGTEQIQRGQVLTHPGQYAPTRRLDARFRLLKDIAAPLKHASEVKFFSGTSETMAAVRLLGVEQLEPGQEGWIQLELRDPIVAVRGDRYILRRPSPGETLGGGSIVDHQPKGRHKRFDEGVLKSLAFLAQGRPSDVLMEAALALEAAPLREIVARSRLGPADAGAGLKELLGAGRLVVLEDGEPAIASDLLALPEARWKDVRGRIERTLLEYHRQYPLRSGIPREELKSRLKLPVRAFNAAINKLAGEKLLAEARTYVMAAGHVIQFDDDQQKKVQALMRQFAQGPYSPPGLKECRAEAGAEVIEALMQLDRLVAVSEEVVFRKEDYDSLVSGVRQFILQNGRITVADARDLFGSSRKYVLALLEHLDAIGMTSRDGDFRRLRA